MTKKDDLFKESKQQVESDFVFDQSVAAVFDDMVSRSVPGYREIQQLLAQLSGTFAQAKSTIYDIGCSTGTTTRAIARAIDIPIELIGVDQAEAMLSRARILFENERPNDQRIRFEIGDLCGRWLADVQARGPHASVIVLCLVLQFIRPPQRSRILEALRRVMHPGGALLLVEKTVQKDEKINRVYIDQYHKFKSLNGYSETEIARKRIALENILVPYRHEENLDLLYSAGFSHVSTFYQWLNFTGYIAIA